MAKVLIISGDLGNLAKVKSACQQAQVETISALRAAAAAPDAEIAWAVIDLGWLREALPEAVSSLRAQYPDLLVIAFGPHVHESRLAEAQSLGCVVLTRGQLERGLPKLLVKN
jgi:DNA-binding NarL/FixJ family response regulator